MRESRFSRQEGIVPSEAIENITASVMDELCPVD